MTWPVAGVDRAGGDGVPAQPNPAVAMAMTMARSRSAAGKDLFPGRSQWNGTGMNDVDVPIVEFWKGCSIKLFGRGAVDAGGGKVNFGTYGSTTHG